MVAYMKGIIIVVMKLVFIFIVLLLLMYRLANNIYEVLNEYFYHEDGQLLMQVRYEDIKLLMYTA